MLQAAEIDIARVHWSDLAPDEFNDFEERRRAACNFWGATLWHALKTAARESEDFVLDLIDPSIPIIIESVVRGPAVQKELERVTKLFARDRVPMLMTD